MKNKLGLMAFSLAVASFNIGAQTIETDLVPLQDGIVKPTYLDSFYTEEVKRTEIPRYYEYFDLGALFSIDSSKITFYTNGKIACDTCSNNIAFGFTDQIMYSADKSVVKNPGQCDQSVSTARKTSINPVRSVSSSTSEKVDNDQFFYDTVYKCTRPNFLNYSENRLTVSQSSKVLGQAAKNIDSTCSVNFVGNTALVRFGKYAWSIQGNDWRVKVKELVDFKDSSESVVQIPWVYETKAIANKSAFRNIDQTLIYRFQPSHAINPQVSEIRGVMRKPFRLFYADFVREALVGIRFYEPETRTELNCALKRGSSGFNDLVQFKVHERP